MRKLTIAARTAARSVIAERGGLGVAVGFYAIVMSVLAGLWRVAAHANGGTIAGYSAVALTWYIATTEASTVSLNIRMIDDVGRDIATGAVAVELLRPASVLAIRVATEVGRAVPRLLALMVTGVVVSSVSAGAPPRPELLLLAAPSLLLAITCNIVAQHAFAGAAFWLRDAGSTWFLYQKLVFIAGGMLIPLELLPGWLHTAANALPFRAMSYIPARLASGHAEPILLLEQVAWIAALFAIAAAVFAAGERRLQVVGG